MTPKQCPTNETQTQRYYTQTMASAPGADPLKCGYCFGEGDNLLNPKILPCSHVYCTECLTNAVAEAKILRCGQCREVSNVAIENLPSAGDVGVTTLFCEPCMQKGNSIKAEVFCTDCVIRFCSKHKQYHGECFDHRIVGIDSYSKQTKKLQPRFCTKHSNQKISMGCRSCRCVFCVDCVDSLGNCQTGRTHQIASLKIIAKEMRADIEVLLTAAHGREGQLSILFKDSSKKVCEFDTETEAEIKELQTIKEEQIRAIAEKYQSLEVEFKRLRAKTKAEITKYQESVGIKQNEVSSTILKVQANLRDGHELDVLTEVNHTKQMIHTVIDEALPSLIVSNVTKLHYKEEQKRDIEMDISYNTTKLTINLFNVVDGKQKLEAEPRDPKHSSTGERRHAEPSLVDNAITEQMEELSLKTEEQHQRKPGADIIIKRGESGLIVQQRHGRTKDRYGGFGGYGGYGRQADVTDRRPAVSSRSSRYDVNCNRNCGRICDCQKLENRRNSNYNHGTSKRRGWSEVNRGRGRGRATSDRGLDEI